MVDKENILNTFSSNSDNAEAVQAKYEVGVLREKKTKKTKVRKDYRKCLHFVSIYHIT